MLTVPIKMKWLDMIRRRVKLEEYRQPSQYWICRFSKVFGCSIEQAEKERRETWIKLRGGYSSTSPTALIRVRVRQGAGRPEWGAEPGENYIVLEIVEVQEEHDPTPERGSHGRSAATPCSGNGSSTAASCFERRRGNDSKRRD